MTTFAAGAIAMAGAIGVGWLLLAPAGAPERLEYLPAGKTAAVQLAQVQLFKRDGRGRTQELSLGRRVLDHRRRGRQQVPRRRRPALEAGSARG